MFTCYILASIPDSTCQRAYIVWNIPFELVVQALGGIFAVCNLFEYVAL